MGLHALRSTIRKTEARNGRSILLRRWFNRCLRGGGMDAAMVDDIAKRLRHNDSTLLSYQSRVAASHYIAHLGVTAASIHKAVDEWKPLNNWVQEHGTKYERGANLYSGFWRGEEEGLIVEEIEKGGCIIIKAMGDGNCLYRSVGVAMARSFPQRLREVLGELRYTAKGHGDLQGLSARYPPMADAAEIAEWNEDHRQLLDRLTTSYDGFLEWINQHPAMDVALVRALRELSARVLERQFTDKEGNPAQLVENITQLHGKQVGGPSTRAGDSYDEVVPPTIHGKTNPSMYVNYIRHIVRQLWEDALSACSEALERAMGVTIKIHFRLDACNKPQAPTHIHLFHHNYHYDILSPPWICPQCTLQNSTARCKACDYDPGPGGAGPSGAGPSGASGSGGAGVIDLSGNDSSGAGSGAAAVIDLSDD